MLNQRYVNRVPVRQRNYLPPLYFIQRLEYLIIHLVPLNNHLSHPTLYGDNLLCDVMYHLVFEPIFNNESLYNGVKLL